MRTDNLQKFPIILQHGFIEKKINFPHNTEWHYQSVLAYRMVFRETNDNSPVNKKDLESYAEQRKTRRGMATNIPEYFGVSLFKDPIMFENNKLFPKPGRKLAKGYVCDSNGPKLDGKNSHICWWLYDNIDLSICKFEMVSGDE